MTKNSILDPWGEPHQRGYPESHRKTSHDLCSKQLNEVNGVKDNAQNWYLWDLLCSFDHQIPRALRCPIPIIFIFFCPIPIYGAADASYNLDNANLSAGVTVTTWESFGPFLPPTFIKPSAESSFAYDFINAVDPALSEAVFALHPPCYDHPSDTKTKPSPTISSLILHVRYPVQDLAPYLPSHKYSCIYLVCDLVSDRTRSIALVNGGRDAYAIWLNGVLLRRITSFRWVEKFADVLPATLREGHNRLVVKVVRGPSQSAFGLTLVNVADAMALEAENDLICLLDHQLINKLSELRPREGMYSLSQSTHIFLTDANGQTIADQLSLSERFNIGKELTPGLYAINASIWGRACSESFYLGDIKAFCTKVRVQLSSILKTNSQDSLNLTAPLSRLEFLTDPSHRHTEKHLGEIEAVQWIKEIELLKRSLACSSDGYRHAPGLHLRGFMSARYGIVEHYMVFAPGGMAKGDDMPLVVVCPNDTDGIPDLINTYIIEYQDVINAYKKAAEKYGFMVLWAYGKNPEHNLERDVDVFEAIEAVMRDYHIDQKRIYVTGNCGSGRDALMLASRHPSYFAAVGVTAPRLHGDNIRKGATLLAQENEYRTSSPIVWVGNLHNIPLMIVHGEQDPHTPLEFSKRLESAAKIRGVKVRLEIIPGADEAYYPVRNNDNIYIILNFFNGKIHNYNPSSIVLQADPTSDYHSDWLSIMPGSDKNQMASCICWVKSSNHLSVKCRNVSQVCIDTLGAPVDKSKAITLDVNGVLASIRKSGSGSISVTVPSPN